MFFFQIFEIRSLIKDAKEASKDPVKFGSRLVLKKTMLGLVISLVVISVFLIFFYLFGYTNLVVNSWTVFKVFFWILLIPSLFVVPLLLTLVKSVSKTLKKFPKEVSVKEIKNS